MTDATDRNMQALIVQMKEIVDAREPVSAIPARRPDWQIWIALVGVIFYSGAIWMNIQSSNAAIEKIMREHKSDMAKAMDNIGSVEDGLIAHIQDENNRALQKAKEERKKLEDQIRRQ